MIAPDVPIFQDGGNGHTAVCETQDLHTPGATVELHTATRFPPAHARSEMSGLLLLQLKDIV
jgi:hypothetical protein